MSPRVPLEGICSSAAAATEDGRLCAGGGAADADEGELVNGAGAAGCGACPIAAAIDAIEFMPGLGGAAAAAGGAARTPEGVDMTCEGLLCGMSPKSESPRLPVAGAPGPGGRCIIGTPVPGAR